MKKIGIFLFLIIIATGVVLAGGQSEKSFPSRPVKAVIGWGAGGGADLVFRALSEVFPKYSDGQTLVIQNKPGAAGVPAITEFMGAKADGYEVLHWNVAHVIKTHMDAVHYEATEFEPIAQVVSAGNYLVVRADAEWETVGDLIADALANPGKIPMGNAGAGGGNHLAALLFEQETDTSFLHVPFGGGGPAITGLMTKDCDVVMAVAPEAIANVQSGQLRILAVFSEERMEALPDVVTGKEVGINLALEQWRGVVAPEGTPPEVIAKLADIFKKCVEDPQYISKMKELGATAIYRTGTEWGKIVAADDTRYEKIIKDGGFGNRY